jgi:hypothetical protein
MRTRPSSLLLHPLFLFSLSLLLLNDFYFKYEFHNWLTGKISDFAGLFLFSVFLIAFFSSYKKVILAFVSLFFLWWKSSLSDPLIVFLNNSFHLPVNRVTDYSDYLTLVAVGLVYYIKPLYYSPGVMRTMATSFVGIVSFFSFTATSMPRHLMYYPYRQNEVRFDKRYTSSKTGDQILQKLETMKIDFFLDSVRFYPAKGYDFYYRIRSNNDSIKKWQPIINNADSSVFVRRADGEFYVLPQYVIDRDTLFNVEFTIHKNNERRKPSSVFLESFRVSDSRKYDNFYDSRLRKKYKKNFRKLFE